MKSSVLKIKCESGDCNSLIQDICENESETCKNIKFVPFCSGKKNIQTNLRNISEYMDIACQSKCEDENLLHEVKMQNGNSEESTAKEMKDFNIYNNENIQKIDIKSHTGYNELLAQKIKDSELLSCQDIKNEPIVSFTSDTTIYANESPLKKIKIENVVIDSQNVKVDEALRDYKPENISDPSENKPLIYTCIKSVIGEYSPKNVHTEVLEICKVEETKLLNYNFCESGNEESSRYCRQCKKIGNLTNHRCTASYQHQCIICSKMFKHKKSLRCHMILHTDDSIFKCKFCGKTCATNSTLLSHLQVHTNEKNYKCNYCLKFYKSNRSLKDHMAVHTGESFECKFCGKTYFHRTSLLCHLLVHNGEKVHSCTTCGKSFNTKGDLNVHLLIHSRGKKHKCLVCGKGFTHIRSLNNHNLLHSEKRYKCDVCGKKFTQKRSLSTHLLVHTINIKSFKCTICEKTFLRKSYLSIHALVHMTKPLYKCDICHQSLKWKQNLRIHLLKHM